MGRSHNRIADQLDLIINDNHSPPLNFHASIVQRAREKRNENNKGRCGRGGPGAEDSTSGGRHSAGW
jgi:hypothetical protein